MGYRIVLCLIVIFATYIVPSYADPLFFDDFEDSSHVHFPVPGWGNEVGGWGAQNGVYFPSSPSNSPLTYSSITSLPNLTDFIVEFDVNHLDDGGIFLRSSGNDNGVLLVTGGYYEVYKGLYWHIVDGSGWEILNKVEVPGLRYSDAHLKVEVKGDTYKAFLNGGTTPITTLITDSFSSGSIALYSNSSQTFDNISVTPEPVSTVLFLVGGLPIVASLYRKRKIKV